MTAGPILQSSASDIHRAYEIAKQCRVAVCDCFYAAMAEREQCELVTADTLFLRAVRQHYPFVIPLPALP